MTDRQPTAAGPIVFRIPADRQRQASGAQTTGLVLGIVVGGGLVMLAVWLPSSGIDVVASLVLGLLGLAGLIGLVVAVARWRRNLRIVTGGDGVVFAVDSSGLVLGAFGRIAWADVAEIVFKDHRTSGGGPQGTPAAYGRILGQRLRERGGTCELDVFVTLRGSSSDAGPVPGSAASDMSRTSNGRTVVRLPFGAALPVDAFHNAYRAVEPVAAAHGVALVYDNKARV
ncbi:hypothetical protein JOE59_000275 [Agromyces cerinus]|uniref:hypothetical protein n=1 Tax=Agromyces cerinus TaxID=33878 RepID=UPI00195BA97F|nr:hypothetical protein [Agromyces cerinus]MBM7829570.1 hypothetical protein [Agromyces cerinus]